MEKKLFKKDTTQYWLDEGLFIKKDWYHNEFICIFDNKKYKSFSAAKNHIRNSADYKLQEYYKYEELIFNLKRKLFKYYNDRLVILKKMDWRQYKDFYFEDLYGKDYIEYNPELPEKTRKQWETALRMRIQTFTDMINNANIDFREYKAKRDLCLIEYKKRLAKEEKC